VNNTEGHQAGVIPLPEPEYTGTIPVEQAVLARRSVRHYKNELLDISALSQLLWAAQGITHPRGWRTAPSAGACYPLELYAAAGNINGLSPGIYKYVPSRHELRFVIEGDIRAALSTAALDQRFILEAPAVIAVSAVYARTTRVYGERGIRYVHMDTGHVCQNVHLQAVSLGLGTVVVGAFRDNDVKRILRLPDDEFPLALMPVGKY